MQNDEDVLPQKTAVQTTTSAEIGIEIPPPPRHKKKGRKLSTSSSIDAYSYCESANLPSTDVLPQQTTTTAVQATTSVEIGIGKPPIVTNTEKVKIRSHHVVYTLPCCSPLIKLIISKFLIEIFTDVPWTLKLLSLLESQVFERLEKTFKKFREVGNQQQVLNIEIP
jgi:hypothetical protein